MADPNRWTEDELIELAARGTGRVILGPPTGPSRVTYDEIAAMAAVLALLGLVPIQPGMPAPSSLELLPNLTIGDET